jgi:PhnB protein
MKAKVNPIPEGYHSLTPYLLVHDAARAIDFYKSVFGATERMRMPAPGGRISHAELLIGDSTVMLADENAEMGALSPKTVGGSPVMLMVYVEDVDDVFGRAVAAGGRATRAVADQFYGDRTGGFDDPFGHKWYVATHIEDVSPEELARRAARQAH